MLMLPQGETDGVRSLFVQSILKLKNISVARQRYYLVVWLSLRIYLANGWVSVITLYGGGKFIGVFVLVVDNKQDPSAAVFHPRAAMT